MIIGMEEFSTTRTNANSWIINVNELKVLDLIIRLFNFS